MIPQQERHVIVSQVNNKLPWGFSFYWQHHPRPFPLYFPSVPSKESEDIVYTLLNGCRVNLAHYSKSGKIVLHFESYPLFLDVLSRKRFRRAIRVIVLSWNKELKDA